MAREASKFTGSAYTTTLPKESKIITLIARSNLADAFAITLPIDCSHDILHLANACLANPAPWVKALLWMRDVAVSVMGVKSTSSIREKSKREGVKTIGFFPIQSQTDDEVVVGEADSHLTFWTSVLVRSCGASGESMSSQRRELVLTTIVHCNNNFGRLYLWIITPFHKLIVPGSLNRAARNGWKT